jgi:hemin uptake protein HemP
MPESDQRSDTNPGRCRPGTRSLDLSAAKSRERIDSARLLGGGRELLIDHAGEEYRLRLTRNDKLILTK